MDMSTFLNDLVLKNKSESCGVIFLKTGEIIYVYNNFLYLKDLWVMYKNLKSEKEIVKFFDDNSSIVEVGGICVCIDDIKFLVDVTSATMNSNIREKYKIMRRQINKIIDDLPPYSADQMLQGD